MSQEFLRWQVGDVRITRIVEDELATLGGLLPDASSEKLRAIPWLEPFLDENGALVLSFHALLVESQGKQILVDTCVGNDKERTILEAWHMRSGPFLDDLARAGATRGSVDLVLCTHLHVDHVGWNTMREGDRWVPTFPNARYLFARTEWEWAKDQPEDMGPVITDSVRPIVDAGLADLVESDHVVTDEVRLEPTPGHTPGHVSIRIESRGEQAVITGDMFHHPCQIAYPEWSSIVDYDAPLGTDTRRQFLEAQANRPVLVIGTHFPTPTAGHIDREEKRGYRFRIGD